MGTSNLTIIYFFYGLAFYSLGLALIIKKRPMAMRFIAPVLTRGAVFGILHCLAEWSLMIFFATGTTKPAFSLYANFFAGLSFLFLFSAALWMLEFRFRKLSQAHNPIIIVFTLIWAGMFFAGLDDAQLMNRANLLSRWLIGAPSGLLLAYGLYTVLIEQKAASPELDRFFDLFNKTSGIKKILLFLVFFTALYGTTHFFGPSGDSFPFNLINAQNFAQTFGAEIVVLRTAIAFFAAVFLIVGLRTLTQIEILEMNERIALQTTTLQGANTQLQNALFSAREAAHAKSKFLANMSHELRTPLNAIIGYTQMLQIYDNAGRDKEIERLGYIETSASNLLGLVEDLLDITSIENQLTEFKITTLHIDTAINKAISELAPTANINRIEVLFVPDQAHEQLKVLADERRLRQVLSNLISNAIKYNTPNGHVKVQHRAIDANTIEISVIDTGMGVSPDRAGHIFEMFQRAVDDPHKAVDGLGIGLAISKAYVEGMGGKIGFENIASGGCRFWFQLPLANQD